MSKAWSKGSTTAWRRVRAVVLQRDQWVCQLCLKPIDPSIKHPDPMSPQVHHIGNRTITGDDPRYLLAAHRICNQRAGEPGHQQHKRISNW